MELAVVLAAGLRDWIDFGVIVRPCSLSKASLTIPQIGILMLNAFVGYYQEKQAGDIVRFMLMLGSAPGLSFPPSRLNNSRRELP
jgi:hypothetical protein